MRLTFRHTIPLVGSSGSMQPVQAEYPFQPDELYNVDFDIGDKTIQCGRHVDTFKLWLMWKAKVGVHHLFH